MTQDQHFDVAAYALGVLDPRDSARFEEHLIECGACAVELESMLPVVDVLADIDADSLVATEQSRRDGVVLHRMINTVGQERRRAQSRRLYSLAAAVVVFAMLAVGSLFAGSQWFGSKSPQSAAPSATGVLDPLEATDGPGVGGEDRTGEHLGATDARTGVRADVWLEAKDWGTDVDFMITNIKGPLNCRLLAVRTDGEQEVLSSWKVGERGWRTGAEPRAPDLQAATALPRREIAHILVQAMEENGEARTLVRVP